MMMAMVMVALMMAMMFVVVRYLGDDGPRSMLMSVMMMVMIMMNE